MRVSIVFVALLGHFAISSLCFGAKPAPDTAITGQLATGEPSGKAVADPAQLPQTRPGYVVKQVARRKTGGRDVTIQEIEPPKEEGTSPNASSPVGKNRAKSPQTTSAKKAPATPKLIVVTATVYGKGKNARSKVTLQCDGKQCTAWSRADFRLMTGFTQFKANGRPYFIISSVTEGKGKPEIEGKGRFQRKGRAKDFAVTHLAKDDKHSRRILRDLHKLYHVEKDKLQHAHQLRKQNAALRKASPSSSPPPKPVTIRFWKRDMEKERKASKVHEGGQQKERGAK